MSEQGDEFASFHGDSGHLHDHILALIQLLAIRTQAASSPLRKELGLGSMDFRAMSVLAAEPEISGARIAEVIGRDEAAVSRSLKPLIARGLIEEVPASGRARRLRLTAEGRAIQQRGWHFAREREKRVISVLTPAQQEDLRAMLRTLLKQMQAAD
jgi:DNA-binding MarR family transcriptional regulator